MYSNFRCRKCNQLISVEYDKNKLFGISNYGLKASNAMKHPHCHIEDGEFVYWDKISDSYKPLTDAISVFNQDREGNYTDILDCRKGYK